MSSRAEGYPIADSWYRHLDMGHGVTRIWEPHVHPLEQANFFHVRGRDRDLLVDSGMGIVPLRESFPNLFGDKEVIAVATHTHVDHIGAIHEFEQRWVHPAEAHEMQYPSGIRTLICSDIPPTLRELFVNAGYPPFDELLIDALPHQGYDPWSYRLTGAAPTRLVTESDVVELGDRRFEILHLPGHSAGSIGLWEPAIGALFTGDLIYDGPLVYEGPGTALDIYADSLRRLKQLPVTVVHAGHDPSFGYARMVEIIDDYLGRWGMQA